MKLKVQRSEPVTRNQQSGLFANPALLSAAFSEEVLESGHNSDVIELGGDRFVVVSVRKHNLPEVMPLAEVRDGIAAQLLEDSARSKVLAAARSVVAALRSGASIAEVAEENGYAWQAEPGAQRDNTNLPPEVLNSAFQMPAPTGDDAVVDLVMTAAGDAQVVSLGRVESGSWDQLSEMEQLALRRQLSTEFANLLNTEYQRGLRASADIVVR
jgi:peptidyl-prolyl cis-trans isomerase D